MTRLSSRIIIPTLVLTGTALTASPRAAVAAPPKAEATSAPTPVAVPAPAPTEAESCVPACRAGFVCARGQCVSRCNPPCANNEICTADGQCILPAQPSLAAPPSAGQYPAPAASAAVGPSNQFQPAPQSTFETQPVASGAGWTNADRLASGASEPAHARLGHGFQVLLSAERLFGYAHGWTNQTPTQSQGSTVSGLEATTTSDTVAFLGNSGAGSLDPKLGVDFSVGPGVTVGGSLVYGYHASESTVDDSRQGMSSTETKTKGPRTSNFGVGARVGYLVMFNDVVGIWPRAGLSYRTSTTTSYSTTATSNVETEQEFNSNFVSIDPDVMLVVSPVPHFAFLFGVGGTVAVTGGYTAKSGGSTLQEGDASGGAIGIAAGLLGYL